MARPYSLAVGLAKLGGVLVSLALVDRTGRRPLLLAATGAQIACLIALCVQFATPSLVSATRIEVTLLCFIFAWNLGWAPLMYAPARACPIMRSLLAARQVGRVLRAAAVAGASLSCILLLLCGH